MRRALSLAARSVGLSSPNPAVGCVLTRDGRVVGEGFHEYDRRDHAEVVALREAGSLARGATAYVSLEPCSHQGRTGPCADALLAAGVRRVVVATRDPNPVVCGRGIEKLLGAGIEVECGLLEADAREINDAFATFTRTSLPFVTLKVAASLDGRIAAAPGSGSPRAWITGEAAREEVHRMRHSADALLTGVGTILADDPLLTDRSGLPRRRPLLRVVLDSALRTPPNSRLVGSANDDVLILFARGSLAAQQALKDRGVRLEQLPACESPGSPSRVCLATALQRLGAMQTTGVLIEAGAGVNASALNEGLVDRLVLFYAPALLGPDAVPMLASNPIRPLRLQSAKESTLRKFGDDFAFTTYLRDPWAGVE